MPCACSKKRRAAAGTPAAPAGTYRVYVGTNKVYETSSEDAAATVAVRFADARILKPGESL